MDKSIHRLALSYLAVIMVMSLSFSVAIYAMMSSHLDRPLPPLRSNSAAYQFSELFEERLAERDSQARMSVIVSLIVLNAVVATGGTILSYYLARRTLQPIEEAMNAQTQFISDASHEIRTPLTVLQTSNEVALRKRKMTEEKAREVFTRNIIEIEKLRSLTDGLLSLASTEQVNVTLDTTKLDSFLEEVAERMRLIADQSEFTLTVDAPSQDVTVNGAALEQIITIFLDNAIKYSPSGTPIELTGRMHGKELTIAVRDRGVGISKKDQERIFDRFYRADEARTRTEVSGHGLGLAIAKQLADRHGYVISCKSTVGKGSTFTLKVPQ